MNILIGTMIVLILCILGWLLFVEVFRNTDMTTKPESASFDTDRDLAILVRDLISAAEARVEADSVSGVGEQFVAIRQAEDNIVYLSKEIKQRLAN